MAPSLRRMRRAAAGGAAACLLMASTALASGLNNIDSVTLDVRPHTTVQFSSDPNGVFGQYLTLLQSCYEAWHSASGPGELTVVAPSWYDLQTFTRNGVQRTYLQWVSMYADVVDILNTRDNAASLVHSGGPGCSFAANNGRKCRFTVDTSDQEYLPSTFRDNGRQQMQRELLSTSQQLTSSVGDAWLGSRVQNSVNFASLGDSPNGVTYDPATVDVGVYVPVAPEAMTKPYINNLWNLFGNVQPAYAIKEVIYPYEEAQLLGQNDFAAMVRQAADRNATVQVLLAKNDWTFSSQHANAVNTIAAVRQLMANIRAMDSNTLPTSGPTSGPTANPTSGPSAGPSSPQPSASAGPSTQPTDGSTQQPTSTGPAPTGTSGQNPTSNPTTAQPRPTVAESAAGTVTVSSVVAAVAAVAAGLAVIYL